MRTGLLPAFLILFCLAGCATGRGDPAPAPPEASASAPPAVEDFPLVGFAGPGTDLAPSPAAVVLLNRGFYERNRRVCEEFIRVPSASGEAAGPAAGDDAIVTRMPLTDDDPDRHALSDCGYVLGMYDYERSRNLMSGFDIADRRGPFLVTIFPGADADGQDAFLIADASDLADARISGFVQEWKGSMASASRSVLQASRDAGPGPDALPPEPDQSRLCDFAQDAVRFTAPVLVEVGRQAFVAYPGVNLIYGFASRSGVGAAAVGALRLNRDGGVESTGGTRAVCRQLRGWINGRILGGRGDRDDE